MIHVSSIVALLWFYRTLYTEASNRTDVARYTIFWITLTSISFTEISCVTIATHTEQPSFTTELPWIAAHTIFKTCFAPPRLVCSFGTQNWSWGTFGTITAIWALCSIWLVEWHLFWRAPSAPEPLLTLLGGNHVPYSITVVAC